MQQIKSKAHGAAVFFDPYAPKPHRVTGGPYCPYFPHVPFRMRRRTPVPQLAEPARKVATERE